MSLQRPRCAAPVGEFSVGRLPVISLSGLAKIPTGKSTPIETWGKYVTVKSPPAFSEVGGIYILPRTFTLAFTVAYSH